MHYQRRPARGSAGSASLRMLLHHQFINPVSFAIVMSIEVGFIIPVKQGLGGEFRCQLDGFASEFDRNGAFGPTHVFDPEGRDENFLSGPPVAGVDDQIADRPRFIVKDEILDVTNLAILGLDMVARHFMTAPKVMIVLILILGKIVPFFTVTDKTVTCATRF